ncbi:MAG: glycerol acyltransferase [Cytophagia bacterium]|nr:MAG: glycerol acyltransferase [Cytophagales bacterium]TAG37204.1 MAG: glycerol acyltransferase [Cytophagia bacterium]TAG56102.1 MAG: glycerol acyltransferase [Runella slithyformis]TAG84107.1 MAG: glycerol acyltransferase [Cytophagales bacterium]
MIGWIIGVIHRALGWKFIGPPTTHLPKAIWVVCPHWTNWDFPIGLWIRHEIGVYIGFFGKHTLFKWYSAWFFRALGGYPVNRNKATNLVTAMVNTIKENKTIHVCITPEGTRDDVETLKNGFYFIALHANIPLVLIGFDQLHKEVTFGPVIYPTGNYQVDMKPLYEFYASIGAPPKKWLKRYEETGEIPNLKEAK